MTHKHLFAALAGLALAAPAVMAADVAPISYQFDQPTACGTYCYHDTSGTELIDGAYGTSGWAADLGRGPAQEWVGWVYTPVVNIDFNFLGAPTIGAVHVGTTQDSTGDVVLPSVSVSSWNGSAWTLVAQLSVPESSANDQNALSTAPHGVLTLSNLHIQGSKVRVTLSQSLDGPWTFADEISFTSAAPVPEPGTWALLAMGLAVVAVGARRRG